MARTRTPNSIPKFIAIPGQPQIYAEGKHEYKYLSALADNGAILPYAKGTLLPSTEVERRIEAIKRDIDNDAIECVIWIVDGSDQHIKERTNHFIPFYIEWLSKKDKEWEKLHVLINTPCLEYWFLLHRTDPPLNDKKGVPICFENAKALLDSPIFIEHCKAKGANLVSAVVRDAAGRKKAIQRAKNLSNHLNNLAEKNLMKVARAEMYQIFELIKVESPSYLSHNCVD